MIARRLHWALAAALGLALLSPAAAAALEVNKDFKPQNEFKLDPWISLKLGPIDMSINKAVFLLFLGAALTVLVINWIANRLQDKPNRVQTAMEVAYDVAANTIVRGNLPDKRVAARWFAFIVTLFFFILFSNLIGLVPLPVDTEHKVDVFGVAVPQLALYGATSNLSVPLVLTLVVWSSYHVEGIRAKGFGGYLASWIPAGIDNPAMRGFIFVIEAISHFVRLISLSVRLFANMLAGHMLILIMGGGMIILLGSLVAVVTLPIGVAFYLFELGLIAGLQAFIFATLTSIYIGGAIAEEH